MRLGATLAVSLLVAGLGGCLDFGTSPAMGPWISHTTQVPANETFRGSVSFVTKYWAGTTEVPVATGLVERSTFRLEGRDLVDPRPGFSYVAWINVENDAREIVAERVGALEPADGVWRLERTFDPPRFIYSASVTLEPVGTQSWRWTAFYPPTGIYDADPGTYPLVASPAYREPSANLTVRGGGEAWRSVLLIRGVEPGHCYDRYRNDEMTCLRAPDDLQFCAWASGMPASPTSPKLVGCHPADYSTVAFDLEGNEPLGEVRVIVSMHPKNETDIHEPSPLRPIDDVLCGGHGACTGQ